MATRVRQQPASPLDLLHMPDAPTVTHDKRTKIFDPNNPTDITVLENWQVLSDTPLATAWIDGVKITYGRDNDWCNLVGYLRSEGRIPSHKYDQYSDPDHPIRLPDPPCPPQPILAPQLTVTETATLQPRQIGEIERISAAELARHAASSLAAHRAWYGPNADTWEKRGDGASVVAVVGVGRRAPGASVIAPASARKTEDFVPTLVGRRDSKDDFAPPVVARKDYIDAFVRPAIDRRDPQDDFVPPVIARRDGKDEFVPPVVARDPQDDFVPPVVARRDCCVDFVPPAVARRDPQDDFVPPVVARRDPQDDFVPPVVARDPQDDLVPPVVARRDGKNDDFAHPGVAR